MPLVSHAPYARRREKDAELAVVKANWTGASSTTTPTDPLASALDALSVTL